MDCWPTFKAKNRDYQLVKSRLVFRPGGVSSEEMRDLLETKRITTTARAELRRRGVRQGRDGRWYWEEHLPRNRADP